MPSDSYGHRCIANKQTSSMLSRQFSNPASVSDLKHPTATSSTPKLRRPPASKVSGTNLIHINISIYRYIDSNVLIWNWPVLYSSIPHFINRPVSLLSDLCRMTNAERWTYTANPFDRSLNQNWVRAVCVKFRQKMPLSRLHLHTPVSPIAVWLESAVIERISGRFRTQTDHLLLADVQTEKSCHIWMSSSGSIY